MKRFKRVPMAVVGIGGVFPRARDTHEFWANVVSGTSAIRSLPQNRWDRSFLSVDNKQGGVYTDRGAFIDEGLAVESTNFGIMPAAAENMEPDQLISLAVADMALSDARQRCKLPAPNRIAVILGKGGYIAPGQIRSADELRESRQLARLISQIYPSMDSTKVNKLTQLFAEQVGGIDSDMAVGMIPNMAASRIANRFDLRGPAYLVDGACASSLVALDHAMSELALGRVDMVLVGGVHHCHDVTLWRLFSQLGALSRSGDVRPFSVNADGTLLGEGTGMVAVKRLEDARQDGDNIYAAITGVGISSDGRGASLVSPSSSAQEYAIRSAWEEARVDISSVGAVGYIEGHGTATPTGDKAELAALRNVLGDDPHLGVVHLGAAKALVGHTMAAAGIVGLIKAVLAISDATIPIMPLHGEPSQLLQSSRLELPTTSLLWKAENSVRRAGLSAFGFGGVNAHAVVEEAPRSRSSNRASTVITVQRAARIPYRFAARTVSELDELLSQPASLLESISPRDLSDEWPVRACLSSVDSKVLELARHALKSRSPLVQTTDLVVCRDPLLGPNKGRTAIVFPGLENQQRTDIEDLVSIAQRDALSTIFEESGSDDVLGKARRAFCLARMLSSTYRQAGFVHLDVMGVSIGELSAAVESERLSEQDVANALSLCDPGALGIQEEMPYAAVAASREHVENLLSDDAIWITHENSPSQTLICGEVPDVRRFLNKLRQHDIVGDILDIASGFHTPLLKPAADYIKALVDQHGRLGAAVPLWSATTGGRIFKNDTSTHLVRLLVEEVRLRSLIEAMWADGVRAFIQLGEGTVPAMIDETLRGCSHIAMSALVPERSAIAQLRWVAGGMWAAGIRMASGTEDLNDMSSIVHVASPNSPTGTARRALSLGNPLIVMDDDRVQAMRNEIGMGVQMTSGVKTEPPISFNNQPDNNDFFVDFSAHPIVRSRRIRIDLNSMPFVRDHQFFRQAPGWPIEEDSYPVLPATTTLALMEREVNELVSKFGKFVCTVELLTLSKWIRCAPGTDISIEVRNHEDRFQVVFDEFASAVFRVSDSWPFFSGRSERADLGYVWRPSMTARQRYESHRLFHGPSFQTLVGFDRCWPSGARGSLKWNGVPGSLLDAVGQLLGCWVQECYRTRLRIMPVKIDRIEYFGPSPDVGALVTCVVNVRNVSDDLVEADMELEVGQRTWCRITGWHSRRFFDSEDIQLASWWPDRVPLAMAHPGGWWSYSLEGEDLTTREFILHNQLGSYERKMYTKETPAARRGWMLSRIAAKDAIRAEMWRKQNRRCFPAEISFVRNEVSGRPIATWTLDGEPIPLHVSLAHSGCVGVAIASAELCGIDVEQVRSRKPGLWQLALSPAEKSIFQKFDTRYACGWDFAMTVAWCAKEAVSKMAGTGLQGDPRRFTVISAEWESDRRRGQIFVDCYGTPARVLFTSENWGTHADTYVVAWVSDLRGN